MDADSICLRMMSAAVAVRGGGAPTAGSCGLLALLSEGVADALDCNAACRFFSIILSSRLLIGLLPETSDQTSAGIPAKSCDRDPLISSAYVRIRICLSLCFLK